MAEPDIILTRERVDPLELARLTRRFFGDMVKYVADIRRGIIALGGELHADAEELLLQDGSDGADLWGANYHPGREPDACIEFISLINIRPSQGNRSMEIEDPATRERVREITRALIGEGEAVP